MNDYDWPRGYFAEYVQIHDDHSGTHIDAPVHMIPPPDRDLPHASEYGLITVDKLPLEQTIGPAAVVDVRPLIDGVPKGEKTYPSGTFTSDGSRSSNNPVCAR
jgi:kynurenine formamidase